MSLVGVPLTLKEARLLVAQWHRHHRPPQGGLFAVGVALLSQAEEAVLCGAAIVGRPVARMAADGWTAEVTRVATDGTPHSCSFLYGACWRAARALGYQRLITYTLPEESGSSLRGAGWTCIGESRGGSWNRRARPRVDEHPTQAKLRWEVSR
jgi:hypothetical protein